MPLGTIDRDPPPFFKQGPSALSRLIVFSALAIALMVVDVRLRISTPIRAAVATALYPVQWVVLQPVYAASFISDYFSSLNQAQSAESQAQEKLALQSMRAAQVELLTLENQRLRELLDISKRLPNTSQGAEVIYDAGDPYTRKVVINRGSTHQVEKGSAILDGRGVLGQVTRVYPFTAEVTLLTDRTHTIPVLNTRTGVRSLATGVERGGADALELRFVPINADVEKGDLLTTSGLDGIYPPGLPVAHVSQVDRRQDAAFAHIEAQPLAGHSSARHVLVVKPNDTASASAMAAPTPPATPATPATVAPEPEKEQP